MKSPFHHAIFILLCCPPMLWAAPDDERPAKDPGETLQNISERIDDMLSELSKTYLSLSRNIRGLSAKDGESSLTLERNIAQHTDRLAKRMRSLHQQQELLDSTLRSLQTDLTQFKKQAARQLQWCKEKLPIHKKAMKQHAKAMASFEARKSSGEDSRQRRFQHLRIQRQYKLSKRYVDGYEGLGKRAELLLQGSQALLKHCPEVIRDCSEAFDQLSTERQQLINMIIDPKPTKLRNLLQKPPFHPFTEKLAHVVLHVENFALCSARLGATFTSLKESFSMIRDVSHNLTMLTFENRISEAGARLEEFLERTRRKKRKRFF